MNRLFLSASFLVAIIVLISCQSKTTAVSTKVEQTTTRAVAIDSNGIGEVVKTAEEWKAVLTAEEYRILREKGTERAFSGKYWDNKEKGMYHCAACSLPLFDSGTKFKSGTGWPSYYQPVGAENVTEYKDNTYGMTRVEVTCGRCDGHLGHVFDDGPAPTGLRYCINSASLKFEKTGK
jgi:peptide-methionine (R)-S-oxide reductase